MAVREQYLKHFEYERWDLTSTFSNQAGWSSLYTKRYLMDDTHRRPHIGERKILLDQTLFRTFFGALFVCFVHLLLIKHALYCCYIKSSMKINT